MMATLARLRTIRAGLGTALAASLVVWSPATHAQQQGEKSDTVKQDAVDAVTQPLTDLNLRKREIPQVLLRARSAPYFLGDDVGCAMLRGEIAELEEVLGPDADTPRQREGLINKGLQIGGDLLGGFIPFRGLVRQLSGANAARAQLEAALYAGIARRSFLKGYAEALECESLDDHTLQSAEDVLGLGSAMEDGDSPDREDSVETLGLPD